METKQSSIEWLKSIVTAMIQNGGDTDLLAVLVHIEQAKEMNEKEKEQQTPIKLPSDEEIEKANPFVWGSHIFGTRDLLVWEQGAKWMRNKIGGKDEQQ